MYFLENVDALDGFLAGMGCMASLYTPDREFYFSLTAVSVAPTPEATLQHAHSHFLRPSFGADPHDLPRLQLLPEGYIALEAALARWCLKVLPALPAHSPEHAPSDQRPSMIEPLDQRIWLVTHPWMSGLEGLLGPTVTVYHYQVDPAIYRRFWEPVLAEDRYLVLGVTQAVILTLQQRHDEQQVRRSQGD